MVDGYINDHINGSQHVLVNQLHTYECLWGRSSDPWYVKDTEGRFIYANSAYLRILGLKNSDLHYDVIGLTEPDLLVRGGNLVSYEELNVLQQPSLEGSEDRTSFFCKFNHKEKEDPFYFLFESMPAVDGVGSVVGFSFHGRSDFIMTIPMLLGGRVPLPVSFISPNRSFSSRELDVFSLLLLGGTSLTISEKLGISKRSAETYIHHVYVKTGVKNHSEFMMYCHVDGIVNFITKKFSLT